MKIGPVRREKAVDVYSQLFLHELEALSSLSLNDVSQMISLLFSILTATKDEIKLHIFVFE
jgi:hypothetical protein